MDYAIGFALATPLLARSEADQWELARITYEVAETNGRGVLTRWATDHGVSLSHASNLRKVWAIYGDLYRGKETDRTFSEYITLARSSPERRRDLIEDAERHGRKVNTSDRAHVRRMRSTREFLRDRRHALELLEDRQVERAMEHALNERRRRRERGDLTDRQIPEGEQLQFDLMDELSEAGEQLDTVLEHLSDATLPKDTRKELVGVVVKIEDRIRSIRSVLQPNRPAAEGPPPKEDAAPPPRRRRITPPPEPEPDPTPVVEVAPDPVDDRPRRDRPDRRGPRRRDREPVVAASGAG